MVKKCTIYFPQILRWMFEQKGRFCFQVKGTQIESINNVLDVSKLTGMRTNTQGCWVKGQLVYFNNNGDWIWCSHPHKNFKTWNLWVLWWLNSDLGLDLNSYGTYLATFCFPWWFEIPNSNEYPDSTQVYIFTVWGLRGWIHKSTIFQHSILYSSKMFCK